MTGRRAAIALAGLLATAAATAPADELVTRDGQVIETQGPWEERGKLLVFRLADGTLASLRLDEADLEATERRARAAQQRAERARAQPVAPAPEPPQAVVVLTDRDVAHMSDPVGEAAPDDGEGVQSGAAGEQGADGAAAASEQVVGSGRGVQVVQWSQESEGETGLSVRGVVQNLGTSFATKVTVNALFYDEAGGLVAAREVKFEGEPLGPGQRRDFSVSLPHSLVYDEIRFQVVGSGFRAVGQSVRAQPPAAGAAGGEEEPEVP